MSAVATPGATRWVAAGVRHEVMLRALPAVRHDLAAPLSVIRMTLLLLKRQQAASGENGRGEERIATLQEQLAVLVEGLALLRGWEVGLGADTITRAALVERCVALLQPLADLQGLSIEVDPALRPAQADPTVPGPHEACWPGATALRYLLLASLCHLIDRRPVPGAIRIEPQGADALRLLATARAATDDDAFPPAEAALPPGRLWIDEAALRCLAEDLQHDLELTKDAVHLPLTAGGLLTRTEHGLR